MAISYALMNLLLYITTFLIVFFRVIKTKKYVGLFVLLIYTVSALCGFLLVYKYGYAYSYNNLSLVAFFHLYVVLMILLYPLLRFNDGVIRNIEVNISLLNKLTYLIVVISLFSYIQLLPETIEQITVASTVEDDAFKEAYSERRQEAQVKTGFNLMAFPIVIANACSELLILLFFYYLTIPKKKLLKFALFFCILFKMLHFMSLGARNGVVIFIMIMAANMILFRNLIDRKVYKKIISIGVVAIVIAVVGIFLITVSRFSKGSRYSDPIESIVDYGGMPMLNFSNYIYEAEVTQKGDNTFPFIRAILGLDYSRNSTQRQAKWLRETRIPLHIFYSVVGDVVIDIGVFSSLLLFIILSYLFRKGTCIKSSTIPFHKLILIYILILIMSQGVFYFTYKIIGGNIKLMAMFAFYFLFKYIHNRNIKLKYA